jgi:hypothetical protein
MTQATRNGPDYPDREAPERAMAAPVGLTRRRAMTILGVVAGIPLLGAGDRAAEVAPLYRWNGTSLGSPSRLLLYHPDRAAAARIVGRCAAEIERLERIFALYRVDSELARLNRDGRLDAPSFDVLALLSRCQRLSALSGGAFDVTVQPLWNLYAAHFFASPSPPPDGPEPGAIERARMLVDWQGINLAARQISLARPGIRLTLNGIAQGYVTDRITEILRDNGCDRTLADMRRSELRAQGRHADGHVWRTSRRRRAQRRCWQAFPASAPASPDPTAPSSSGRAEPDRRGSAGAKLPREIATRTHCQEQIPGIGLTDQATNSWEERRWQVGSVSENSA